MEDWLKGALLFTFVHHGGQGSHTVSKRIVALAWVTGFSSSVILGG